MKGFWSILSGFFGFMLLVLSCTPQPSPAVAPTPRPNQTVLGTPVPSSSVPPGPEEIAWTKTVEAARKEGTLVAYSYNMTGDTGVAVSRSFQEKYGIKLELITGGGAALAERIRVEKRAGNMAADVMDANTFQIANIKDADATQSSEGLPALREIDVWRVEPWANDPQRHILIHTFGYSSFIINSNLVKAADEPRSLKELAQAKWKGKMISWDPRQDSGKYEFFLPLLKRNLINIDTVQAIGQNDVTWTATMMDAVQNIMRGQYALFIGGGITFSDAVRAEPSLPVKLLDFEEGVVVSNLAAGLVKNSPHPNAAKLFVNWMFTQEGQRVFVTAKARIPVRKDVADFTPGSLRFTPSRPVLPTLEDQQEIVARFRDGYLAKLWGK